MKNRPSIPAVEIDPAGCSYNPDRELHQDVIAQAVAAEYSKQIDRELQPKVKENRGFSSGIGSRRSCSPELSIDIS